jgi:outer membrane autotransporter protein
MSNKKFLKNLLTTASAISIIAGGAASASADNQTTNANATITENGANATGFVGGVINWTMGDSVIFDANAARTLTTGADGDVTIGDVSGGTGDATIITANAAHTTNIANVKGDNIINATLGGGSTLTFTGEDLSALGTIDGAAGGYGTFIFAEVVAKGHVGAIGETYWVNEVQVNGAGASTFDNAMTGETLTVGNASDGTTFNGDIWFTDLALNGDNTTFAAALTVTNLTLAAGKNATTNGALNLAAGGAVLNNGSTFTIGAVGGTNGGTINSVNAGNGTLVFEAVVTAGQVGTIGNARIFGAVEVNAAGNSTFDEAINATTLTVGANAGDTTFTAAVDSTNVTLNGDNTTFDDDLTVTNLTLAAGKAATTDAGLFTLNTAATLGDGAILTIGAGGIAGGGTIDGAAAGNGTVNFTDVVTAGDVGVIGGARRFGTVDITGTAGGGSEFDAAITATNLITQGDTTTFTAAVDSTNVTLDGANTIFDALTATNLTLAAGKNATTNAASTIKMLSIGAGSIFSATDKLSVTDGNGTGEVKFTGNGALILNAASVIDVITTATTKEGVVAFRANPIGTIGKIGTADHMLSAVITYAPGKLVFANDVYTETFVVGHADADITSHAKLHIDSNLAFTADGKFTFASDQGLNIASIAVNAADRGNVVFNAQVTARDATAMTGVGEIGQGGYNLNTVTVNYVGENTFSDLVNTKTLTLGAGANLTTGKALTVTEDFNIGKNSTFTSGDAVNVTRNMILASGAKIIANKAVTTNGLIIDNGSFTANDVLNLGAALNFTANGSLIISATGSITGGQDITTAQAGTGSVYFKQLVAAGNVGAIGAGRAIHTLTVNATGDNTFNDNIAAQNILLAKGANIVASNGVTASTAVVFADEATLTVTGASNITAITTANPGTGSVVFNNAINVLTGGTGVGTIGTAGAALKDVTITDYVDTSTLGSDVYVGTLTLDNNANSILLEVQKSFTGNIAFKGNINHRVAFLGGSKMTGNITTDAMNKGRVGFVGNSTFVGDLGSNGTNLNWVSIDAGVNTNINGNIYATDFFNRGTLTLGKDMAISSDITATSGSTLNLAGHNLTANGVILGAADNMNVNFGSSSAATLILTNATIDNDVLHKDSIIRTHFDSMPYIATVGSEIELIKATVVGGPQADLMNTYLTKQVTLANTENAFLKLDGTIKVKQNGNQLIAYTTSKAKSFDEITKAGYGTVSDNATQNAWSQFLEAYIKETLGQIEKQYFANAGTLTPTQNAELFTTLSTVTQLINMIATSHALSHNEITNDISSRLSTSGDEGHKMGVWAQGFGAKATQKARSTNAGFKSTSMGLTLGADTEISDNSLLGLAGSFSNADTKLKDQLAGGKVKAKTYGISLYGAHNINQWVMQGALSVSHAKSTVNTSGSAKFTSTNFGARTTIGYKYSMNDVMLTPMAGLEFARFGKSNATETGTYQRVIKNKALNKLSAIIGAKLSTRVAEFTPEIHALMDYNLTGKAQKSSVGLGSDATVNIATPSAKPVRATFNLGASVTGTSDNIEYGIGYDATLAKKYIAHQGSIKVRLNF